jgi:hypothetical protein
MGISKIIGQKEPPRFEDGGVHVEVQQGVVFLQDLELRGSSMNLFGEGYLGPQRFDMHLFPEVAVDIPFVDIPVLGTIFNWFAAQFEKEVLSFRFEGPYRTPRVVWDPVSGRPEDLLGTELDRPRLSEPPLTPPKERF